VRASTRGKRVSEEVLRVGLRAAVGISIPNPEGMDCLVLPSPRGTLGDGVRIIEGAHQGRISTSIGLTFQDASD
jgi:hypothetical protein